MVTTKGLLEIANILVGGISAGLEVYAVAKTANEILEKMVREDRDPTEAELDEVFTRIRGRSSRIRNG